VLAEEAKRLGAFLVHYSTDYVFDGEKRTPYGETDLTNPLNEYGRSKLAGEQAILASGCRCLILRASWVYALRGKNFFLTIAKKATAGDVLRVVDDQVGVPTTAAFLARATVAALQENRGQTTIFSRRNRGLSPVYHVVPDGETSWCGFARAIVARIAPGCEVAAIRSSEYPQAARRPAHAVLDNRLAHAEIGLPPVGWESLLEECVAAYRSHRDDRDR
jgi:dTDP-4-dehydrorhamnose reductase